MHYGAARSGMEVPVRRLSPTMRHFGSAVKIQWMALRQFFRNLSSVSEPELDKSPSGCRQVVFLRH
jgi:hypothetical protein